MSYYVAGAIVVSAVYGGSERKKASERATDQATRASQSAQAMQWEQYMQSREDLAPWRESGQRSLSQLNRLQGLSYIDYSQEPNAEGEYQRVPAGEDGDRGAALRERPGYQFRLDEGLKALRRRAAAGSVTGRTSQELIRYGQDYASGEYEREYNRLALMSGQGQTAATTTGQFGAQAANLRGQYEQYAGNVRAANEIAQGNIRADTASSIASAYAGAQGGGFQQKGGSNFSNYYSGDRVAPGGSFGGNDPYAGAGGYGDNWTDY